MKEITTDYATTNNLKRIGKVSCNDMSKVILMIERLKEDKKIKYYIVEMILFDQYAHKGVIRVSFWGD